MSDIVFTILEQMLSNSPESSYKRLNPALSSTMRNCIRADLPFAKDTFSNVFNKLRGGYWFGDGAGSSIGEAFYVTACGCNHVSACVSFEAFAERPAVLWEEDVKSPFRLHVGARLTWKGTYLTVTSMRHDSLVACAYKDSVVTKRVTLTYAEIAEFRRTEKDRLKDALEKIEQCDPEKDGPKLSKFISSQHFRHFQLEVIQSAFSKRKDFILNQSRIESWRNGENGAWLETSQVYLRVKGDRVECSNGNAVSLSSVKRVLPLVMSRRKKRGALSENLDAYTVKETTKEGVRVGCTLVPWPEVERLAKEVAA